MRQLAFIALLVGTLATGGVMAPSEDSGAAGKGSAARPATRARRPAKGGHWRELGAEAARVVEACGTEPPFSGEYVRHHKPGTYTCARCGAPLFDSDAKFDSGSGWPSFDQTLPGALRELPDPDGRRVEIRCARCDGHLGHVFRGEHMTARDTRHCVNSVSLGFSPHRLREAFFAGGCFWGVEYMLESLKGVVKAESGYMGGRTRAPSYQQVSTGRTGHAETVRVLYEPGIIDFETLARRFFEIHDPTQVDRQGPDRGSQYRSEVFVTGPEQGAVIDKLVGLLRKKGYAVATKVERAGLFWPAEAHHQDWYHTKGTRPSCHVFTARF